MAKTYRLLALVALLTVSAIACGSDPKIIVPNDFHGTAQIAFCMPSSKSPTIKLGADGTAKSEICDHTLRKYAIQRANGQTVQADIQTATTGDGYIVSATFQVP